MIQDQVNAEEPHESFQDFQSPENIKMTSNDKAQEEAQQKLEQEMDQIKPSNYNNSSKDIMKLINSTIQKKDRILNTAENVSKYAGAEVEDNAVSKAWASRTS